MLDGNEFLSDYHNIRFDCFKGYHDIGLSSNAKFVSWLVVDRVLLCELDQSDDVAG